MTSNGRPCRPTRSWRKRIGAPSRRRIDERHDEQDRAEQHQPGQRQDDVDGALREHAQRPVRAVHERENGHALDLLEPAARQHQARPDHRDPDDPALVLAQAGDRLDHGPVGDRKADGDLVDDGPMEDRLDLVELAEHGPTDTLVVAARAVGRTGQIADRLEAELDVPRHQVGEGLGRRVGTDDEHVAGVAAARPHVQEDHPDRIPAGDGQYRLRGEQQHQEQPADVRQLEQEQGGEDDHRQEQDGEQDVERLAPPRPANAQPVQALDPQDGDERQAIEQGRQPAVDARRRPDPLPAVGSEADHRQADEQRDRGDRVGEHQRQVQCRGVSTDQVRSSTSASVASDCTPRTSPERLSRAWDHRTDVRSGVVW